MSLQAIVIGSGWAGEGHTRALRDAGVEVVAMCGRTPEATFAKAQTLGIPEVRFDWRKALDEFRPNIVSIATSAAPNCEMAVTAAEQGCHVACDKPLAINATEARMMLQAVERAGVKHAYLVTSRYAPACIHARQLLAEGYIGEVQEIDYVIRTNNPSLSPFWWFHQLSLGGGVLNGGFTHMLAQVQHVTAATVVAVSGDAQRLVDRLPVVPTLHDSRQWGSVQIDPEQAKMAEWREVDADQGFRVLLHLCMPGGNMARALIRVSFRAPCRQANYLAFYGTNGALELTSTTGLRPDQIHHYSPQNNSWAEVPIPGLQNVAQVENGSQRHYAAQRDWNQLFREFVADVRGEEYCGYPTFRDGWTACEIMDIVRSGESWQLVPEEPVTV